MKRILLAVLLLALAVIPSAASKTTWQDLPWQTVYDGEISVQETSSTTYTVYGPVPVETGLYAQEMFVQDVPAGWQITFNMVIDEPGYTSISYCALAGDYGYTYAAMGTPRGPDGTMRLEMSASNQGATEPLDVLVHVKLSRLNFWEMPPLGSIGNGISAQGIQEVVKQ